MRTSAWSASPPPEGLLGMQYSREVQQPIDPHAHRVAPQQREPLDRAAACDQPRALPRSASAGRRGTRSPEAAARGTEVVDDLDERGQALERVEEVGRPARFDAVELRR